MNRIFKSVLVAASIVSFASAQASVIVAELGTVTGKVLINHGKGFVPADGLISLNAGDQLMVGEKSSAVVNYASGCAVSVSATQVVTISAKAPCKAGEKVAMIGDTAIAPAGDGPMAAPGVYGLGGALPLLLIGGGVAATAAILLLTRNTAPAGSATAL
jgi:hypothetical protein